MLQRLILKFIMKEFIDYIEKTLSVETTISKFEISNELPLYLRGRYDILLHSIYNIDYLLVKSKDDINLSTIRNDVQQLKKITNLNCVVCFDNISRYTKAKMITENIPFVVLSSQIFMPFIGIAISKENFIDKPHIKRISSITQKLLLLSIYQGWDKVTVTEAAALLGITKMSISRAFDEIEQIGIAKIKTEGKKRLFSPDGSKRDLWDKSIHYFRNPVIKQFCLDELPEICCIKTSGLSALSYYSMLSEENSHFYAIAKNQYRISNLMKIPVIPHYENANVILQVLSYNLDYNENTIVDPLTVILSLTDKEKSDPRVESTINEVLKVYLDE